MQTDRHAMQMCPFHVIDACNAENASWMNKTPASPRTFSVHQSQMMCTHAGSQAPDRDPGACACRRSICAPCAMGVQRKSRRHAQANAAAVVAEGFRIWNPDAPRVGRLDCRPLQPFPPKTTDMNPALVRRSLREARTRTLTWSQPTCPCPPLSSQSLG